jgi:signal transduction histidine kinase
MSRGMAHDLNNLLTPVWTLLQLSSEEGSNTFDEDLLPVALRNIKTMRAYIREALFFSRICGPIFSSAGSICCSCKRRNWPRQAARNTSR